MGVEVEDSFAGVLGRDFAELDAMERTAESWNQRALDEFIRG